MAQSDEKEIVALEKEASQLGYSVMEQSYQVGERELANEFRWIAVQLYGMSAKHLIKERKEIRQEISKRTKELGDVVREKYIQHQLPFRCIDDYDECVWKRKRQRQSTYLCSVALYICLARSMTGLLAAIAAAAKAGGHLG